MSRGTPALIGMLFVLSLIIVLVAGAVIAIAGVEPKNQDEGLTFSEAVWASFTRALDAGTMGSDEGAAYRR